MSKRLFVGGLPYAVQESDLKDLFATAGKVIHINLVRDRETNNARHAFVEMATDEEAEVALNTLHESKMMGASFA